MIRYDFDGNRKAALCEWILAGENMKILLLLFDSGRLSG